MIRRLMPYIVCASFHQQPTNFTIGTKTGDYFMEGTVYFRLASSVSTFKSLKNILLKEKKNNLLILQAGVRCTKGRCNSSLLCFCLFYCVCHYFGMTGLVWLDAVLNLLSIGFGLGRLHFANLHCILFYLRKHLETLLRKVLYK